MDVIQLSIFSSRLSAICEEMGAVLKRAAFSPNIKDRLDFSCAIFDGKGELCAQAAHIPVHLGSMAYAMRDIVGQIEWADGDTIVLNDPFLGGTHLPDVTMISPVFVSDKLAGFVVNRAHHADIGASSPGSMPISTRLDQEGIIIPPSRLVRRGNIDHAFFEQLTAPMRDKKRARGDFSAQLSANSRGVQRLQQLIHTVGFTEYAIGLDELNAYGERIARHSLRTIKPGRYGFVDYLDDDGQGQRDIAIRVMIDVAERGDVIVNFAGTSEQVKGNLNCPLSVAAAGVYYAFRCLMPKHTPACAGVFRTIAIRAPDSCLLNAKRPAAVAAGNVETSMRVVDAVLGALAQVIPERIAAASQGTMNNLAMGSADPQGAWDYYETIGGGMGANAKHPGLDAVQTHMTNTLNTPIEVIEMNYPLRVTRYEIRLNSGGNGQHRGGDGIVREYEFLRNATFTLLTERRKRAPWGLAGGKSGQIGSNTLDGRDLASKISCDVSPGQRLRIETPGGGGWG